MGKHSEPNPSETQSKALLRMIAGDGTAWRENGGFWVSSNDVLPYIRQEKSIPLDIPLNDIWCDVRTIRAMEKRGWVERTNKFLEEWRDIRRITAAGWAVVGRVDVKAILRDPVQRRELMVRTIIATQAREGIVTTREQAENAYDKVWREKESK